MLPHAHIITKTRQLPRCLRALIAHAVIVLCLAAPTLASTIKPGLTVQQASDRLDFITCTLARAYHSGRLDALQYTRIFHLRTEAAELVTRWQHLEAIGDPRALQAEHEARAACVVLELAVEGITENKSSRRGVEAPEAVTKQNHFHATGDPRALAAWHEAGAACAVLEMAVEGVVPK